MKLFDLSGKTALITGASSGIGERFAYALSNAGARVIIAARRFDKLQDLAKQLKNALAIEMNVSDNSSIINSFKKLENLQEKIDICINCAGIAGRTSIFESDNDNFENIIQTNVLGVWYVTKAVANHMKQHNIHGSIINIASVCGINYSRTGLIGYSASKTSVIQLTKCSVGELAEAKIRINTISPGVIVTPMASKVQTEEGRREQASRTPLQFVGEPSDLDGAILFLACNKAFGYMTGSNIIIDGGYTWGGE